MPKILLLRLSSMGDIIHNFPAVTELRTHLPNAELHWAVEENFAELASLHPAVQRVHRFALRRWRRQPWSTRTRTEYRAFGASLRAENFDLAIDSQGLFKSAWVGRLSGAPIAGYSRKTAREPLASLFYDRRYYVPRVHVIERNRLLTGRALDYIVEGALDYGIHPPPMPLEWLPRRPYAVCLTATARDAKLWPEDRWIAAGRWLCAQGLQLVFPWGKDVERERAARLAAALPDAVVPPRVSLLEAARLLADARLAIGVDTGFTHLAAAVDAPTIGIYCDSDSRNVGVLARGFARNLGGVGQAPSVAEVQMTLEQALAA